MFVVCVCVVGFVLGMHNLYFVNDIADVFAEVVIFHFFHGELLRTFCGFVLAPRVAVQTIRRTELDSGRSQTNGITYQRSASQRSGVNTDCDA